MLIIAIKVSMYRVVKERETGNKRNRYNDIVRNNDWEENEELILCLCCMKSCSRPLWKTRNISPLQLPVLKGHFCYNLPQSITYLTQNLKVQLISNISIFFSLPMGKNLTYSFVIWSVIFNFTANEFYISI